jgi:NADP-dependent 3-hydroxy acid dehydrogenase YdfG
MDLKNKVAVVTGVSRGIGLAIVRDLLKEGMIVAGWGRTAPELTDPGFHFFLTNIRDNESVKNSFQQTVESLGDNIHVLVNNAGLGYYYSFEDTPIEKVYEMFETNVYGVYYVSRLIVPQMKRMEAGHIINISSIAGTNGIESMSAYCGTKFALRGISLSMMKELRKFGIKVTTVYPGSVKTNFFDEIDVVTANDHMMMPEDISSTVVHVLKTPANYLIPEVEARPLQPKGK